ncbi:Hypothetical predicted protein [Marmota monax]|uniref:Uncharacterized protein n=1 Tax=Marmota monax TaxID=9995 RepID=A0A5E4CMP0_MARMO|nr:hypothetical protein GHT09_012794 [Marmota monax]VTJ83164.1 Hypothetical predicted protein [Marmota monax]
MPSYTQRPSEWTSEWTGQLCIRGSLPSACTGTTVRRNEGSRLQDAHSPAAAGGAAGVQKEHECLTL